jgi:hypothetical protein
VNQAILRGLWGGGGEAMMKFESQTRLLFNEESRKSGMGSIGTDFQPDSRSRDESGGDQRRDVAATLRAIARMEWAGTWRIKVNQGESDETGDRKPETGKNGLASADHTESK